MDDVVKLIRQDERVTVVEAEGEITLARSPEFHMALAEFCAQRPGHLLIHLAKVEYLDSSGVGALVDIARRVRAYSGKLALVAPTARVRGVLEITKLDQFFTIVDQEDEALPP